MGEIADMMLEGDLCEACGVALHLEEAPGYPVYCSVQCAKDRGIPKKDWKHCVEQYLCDQP